MKLLALVNTDLPFVVYKKPHSAKLHIVQQNSPDLHTDKSLQSNGFYFAPFDIDKHPIIVIKDDDSTKQSYFVREFEISHENTSPAVSIDETDKQSHLNKVQQAIDLIQAGHLDKMIISRKIVVKLPDFNPFDSLIKLMQSRDESFVYYWHHPQVASWMGATPELLINYQENTLETVALAGTLPVKTTEPVTWTIKEIKEQKIVSDYIESKLKRHSSQVKVEQAKTVFQGKIAHIKNEISCQIDAKDVNKVILELHPTPAVCGLPTTDAKKYISSIENYDRKYYTGFLGCKQADRINFFVNLRCLDIENKLLSLYVGGGIVKDSIADREWKETIYKSQVLLNNL